MSQKELGPDAEAFLGKLLFWCYRWGCEVSLRNRARDVPLKIGSPWMVNENFERQRDGSFADLSRDYRIKADFPELTFSRNDLHVAIMAQDWDSLIRRIEHEYKIIFMELSVPIWSKP